MESMERIKKQKLLITGGAGFIGSHLISTLLDNPLYEIIVPYIYIDPKSFFAVENLSKRVTLEKIDITDLGTLSRLVRTHRINFIFHLAAQTIVADAYNDPLTTFNTNIMGTVNLLEIMRKNPLIKGMIFASSDKAYGKTDKAYSENFPLQGNHPYDVSKSSADLIVQTYFKTYELPVVITRVANTYGEGDLHFDRIIPGICKSLVRNEELLLRSDGTFVRDYIYVKDVVKGYMFLLENLPKIVGEAYNFSSNDSLSVINLIKKSEQILGKKISYKIINIQKNEIPFQHLDCSKIKKLGWNPLYSLENSLEKTFQWYSQHL